MMGETDEKCWMAGVRVVDTSNGDVAGWPGDGAGDDGEGGLGGEARLPGGGQAGGQGGQGGAGGQEQDPPGHAQQGQGQAGGGEGAHARRLHHPLPSAGEAQDTLDSSRTCYTWTT